MTDLVFQDWGLIDYEEALHKQLSLVEEIHSKNLPGYLIFCSHPPVVTTGRATQPEDIFAWQGPTVEVSRGGRATYHGPSQLIIYPLINLEHIRKGRPLRDINGYLRAFEDVLVKGLRELGITSQRHTTGDETGIWVDNLKVVSVGVAIKSWVSLHGAAVNISDDPQAFQGIKPCGFPSETMVSLEKLKGSEINLPLLKSRLKDLLLEAL